MGSWLILPSFAVGPDKPTSLKALGKQAFAPCWSHQFGLDQVTSSATEHEHMSRVRIFSQILFSLRRLRFEPASHVRHIGGQPHPRVARHRDQVINPCILDPEPHKPLWGPPPEYDVQRIQGTVQRVAHRPQHQTDFKTRAVFGRVDTTNDESTNLNGKKGCSSIFQQLWYVSVLRGKPGILQPFEDQIGIHRISTRDLRYRYTCRRRLFTDRALLVIRPDPLLLTLRARPWSAYMMSTINGGHYQTHLHIRQCRHIGRLRITCLRSI